MAIRSAAGCAAGIAAWRFRSRGTGFRRRRHRRRTGPGSPGASRVRFPYRTRPCPDGAGDHAGRPFARAVRAQPAQQRGQRGQVVAVDLVHVPAEGAPLVGQRFHADHVVDPAVELIAVAIDDGDQVGQPVMRGEQRRFPDLPFLHLAVAQHDEDAEIALAQARADRHAGAVGQRVADGAGAEVHAGHLAHVGMVAQRAAQAGVVIQPCARKEILVGQHREQADGDMPLAHEEAVAVRPGGLARPQPHHAVVQRGEDLGAGKDGAVVADLGDLDQADGFEPDVAGLVPQRPKLVLGGHFQVRGHGVSCRFRYIIYNIPIALELAMPG